MDTQKERIRLLADRLCYLEHGVDGLRRRHGMWRSDKTYRDKYDRIAEERASELLPQRELPKFGQLRMF